MRMSDEVDIQQDEMKEIIDDFLVEADELIDSLDNNFIKLESSPGDLDLLNEIFRAVHTVKGTSSFLGFEQVTTLSHRMEDIINKLRKSEMVVTPEVMDLLLESLDLLKVLLDNVHSGRGEEVDLGDILARLSATLTSQGDQDLSDEVAACRDVPEGELQPKVAKQQPPPKVSESTDAASLAAEVSHESIAAPKSTGTSKRLAAEQTIRVDVQRLDTLMNMMGELVLSRNSLIQAVNALNSEHEGEYELASLNQSSTSVNFITTELQMAVMKMRMQPIGKVFKRYPRLVRDLARESEKQIELRLSGETTELDKSVIEEIGDPLVHVIRNSCDHGIESPQERTAKGKPPAGTIHLAASQEGSNIVIKITDDGRGFDTASIRAKAVERGLATRAEVDKMPYRDVYHFIFEAGLSTAKKITDVSGRGVGMDVVRSNIEKLNGLIELDSQKDFGTTMAIRLPLTLAIIQGLLVQCDEEVFILPLSSVLETVKIAKSEICYINQRPVLRLRDEIIPVINLVHVLGKNRSGFILTEKPYIVVVGLAEKKLGLIVDRFIGQEEVVIKSLGSYLGVTQGMAGATILGDGRVRLIVDLNGLFNIARKLN
jgi:two-component system chemotaxis sensor kinase CheA